jgi:hypothetical protein
LQVAVVVSHETCVQNFEKIKIIHVHGQLGPSPTDEHARPPYGEPIKPNDIIPLRLGIKVIHEAEDDSLAFEEARACLSRARKICFLGFGFHETNLRRLFKGIATVQPLKHEATIKQWSLASGVKIFASGYGLSDAKKDAIQTLLPLPRCQWGDRTHDCKQFLNESGVLEEIPDESTSASPEKGGGKRAPKTAARKNNSRQPKEELSPTNMQTRIKIAFEKIIKRLTPLQWSVFAATLVSCVLLAWPNLIDSHDLVHLVCFGLALLCGHFACCYFLAKILKSRAWSIFIWIALAFVVGCVVYRNSRQAKPHLELGFSVFHAKGWPLLLTNDFFRFPFKGNGSSFHDTNCSGFLVVPTPPGTSNLEVDFLVTNDSETEMLDGDAKIVIPSDASGRINTTWQQSPIEDEPTHLYFATPLPKVTPGQFVGLPTLTFDTEGTSVRPIPVHLLATAKGMDTLTWGLQLVFTNTPFPARPFVVRGVNVTNKDGIMSWEVDFHFVPTNDLGRMFWRGEADDASQRRQRHLWIVPQIPIDGSNSQVKARDVSVNLGSNARNLRVGGPEGTQVADGLTAYIFDNYLLFRGLIGTNAHGFDMGTNWASQIPLGWDISSGDSSLEIVNERAQPVFQIHYDTPTSVRIYGIFTSYDRLWFGVALENSYWNPKKSTLPIDVTVPHPKPGSAYGNRTRLSALRGPCPN